MRIPSFTYLFAIATTFAAGVGAGTQPWGESFFMDGSRLWIAFWIFSAIVQNMPDPARVSNVWYEWLYKALNVIGSNLQHAGWFNNHPEPPK